MPLQDLYPLTDVEDSADRASGIRVNRGSGPDAQIFWSEDAGRWLFGREGSENAFQIARTLETVSTDFEVTAEDQNKLFVVQTDGSGELLTATLSGENVPVGTTVDFLNNGSGGFDFRGAIGEGVNRIGSVVQGEFTQATWTGNKWAIEGARFVSGLALDLDTGGSYESPLANPLVDDVIWLPQNDRLILQNRGDVEVVEASTLTQLGQAEVSPTQGFSQVKLTDESFPYFPNNDVFLGYEGDTVYAIDGNNASRLDSVDRGPNANTPVGFAATGEYNSSTGAEYGIESDGDSIYSFDVTDISGTYNDTGITPGPTTYADLFQYFPSLGIITTARFNTIRLIDVDIDGLTVTENSRKVLSADYDIDQVLAVDKQSNQIVYAGANEDSNIDENAIVVFDVENETFESTLITQRPSFQGTSYYADDDIIITSKLSFDTSTRQVLSEFTGVEIVSSVATKPGNDFFYVDPGNFDTSEKDTIKVGTYNEQFSDVPFEQVVGNEEDFVFGSPRPSGINFRIESGSSTPNSLNLNASQNSVWSGTVYNDSEQAIRLRLSDGTELNDPNEKNYVLPKGTCEIEYNGNFWQATGDVALVGESRKTVFDDFYDDFLGPGLNNISPSYNPSDELLYVSTGADIISDFDGLFAQDLDFQTLSVFSPNETYSTRQTVSARSRGTVVLVELTTRAFGGNPQNLYVEEYRDAQRVNSFTTSIPFYATSPSISYNEVDQEVYIFFGNEFDFTQKRFYVFDLETQSITTNVSISDAEFPDTGGITWNAHLQAIVTNEGLAFDRNGNKVDAVDFDFSDKSGFGRSLNPRLIPLGSDIFDVKREEFLVDASDFSQQYLPRNVNISDTGNSVALNTVLNPELLSLDTAIRLPAIGSSLSPFGTSLVLVDETTSVAVSEAVPAIVTDTSKIPPEAKTLSNVPEINGFLPKIIDSTPDYTVGVWDMERGVDIQNTGNTTVNIPIDSNSRFDTGDTVEIQNTGGGVVQFMGEFNPSTGEEAVITTEASYILDSDAEVTLRKTAPNTWRLESDDLYTYDGTNYIKS